MFKYHLSWLIAAGLCLIGAGSCIVLAAWLEPRWALGTLALVLAAFVLLYATITDMVERKR